MVDTHKAQADCISGCIHKWALLISLTQPRLNDSTGDVTSGLIFRGKRTTVVVTAHAFVTLV